MDNKQIEEMACEMCGNKDFCPVNPNVCISYRCNLHSAKMLLDRGYRKERQGEWEYTYTYTVGLMNYECSLCGRITTTPKADKYCPHCGAHMKGDK
jgi:hypothetical protein